MKERFKTLKSELDKLIKEKRRLFNNKTKLKKNVKLDLNIESNSNKENIKNNDDFYFLELKYNILSDTLKKLSKAAKKELEEDYNIEYYKKYIKEIKNKVNKELIQDEQNLEKNLNNIELEYNNYIQKNNNEKENMNKGENNSSDDNYKIKLGEIINFLDKNKEKEENDLIKIKKELNSKIEIIKKEIKNESNNANFLENNKIKKLIDYINNELDKGKSYEYLKRNEFKETINSILNDILMKLEMEK